MIDGGVAVIGFQVLLRYVGRVLRPIDEYVVPGLVLRRTRSCNGLVPLLGRLKIGINVDDDAAILKESMMNQIANSESCSADIGYGSHILFPTSLLRHSNDRGADGPAGEEFDEGFSRTFEAMELGHAWDELSTLDPCQ